jgi:hypothetical protein
MSTELQVDIAPWVKRRYGNAADAQRVIATVAALEGNGIRAIRAANRAEAKRIVLDLIPDGSQVHAGASQTLDVSGITEVIEKSGRYESVRPQIWRLDRTTQAEEFAACLPRQT